MGLYNEIQVDCPKCDQTVTFQSKSGECELRTYHITNMPPEDFAGILGDCEECEHCGTVVAIDGGSPPREDFTHYVK